MAQSQNLNIRERECLTKEEVERSGQFADILVFMARLVCRQSYQLHEESHTKT